MLQSCLLTLFFLSNFPPISPESYFYCSNQIFCLFCSRSFHIFIFKY
jgi:hypothetical protein